MKRLAFVLALWLIAPALAGCGGDKGATSPDARTAQQASAAAAQAEPSYAEGELLSDEAVMAMASQPEPGAPFEDEAPAVGPVAVPGDANRPVDLDLTRISGTVVYSQVYDMMMEPEAYMGQKVKLKGSFSYYQDPDTRQEYFAAVIADATACCAQGIEFVWRGEHAYPRDYPPLDTEITVTGIFDTYCEDDYMYVRLTDADVRW